MFRARRPADAFRNDASINFKSRPGSITLQKVTSATEEGKVTATQSIALTELFPASLPQPPYSAFDGTSLLFASTAVRDDALAAINRRGVITTEASGDRGLVVQRYPPASMIDISNEFQPFLVTKTARRLPWVALYTSAVLPLPSSSGRSMLKSLTKTCNSRIRSYFNQQRCAALKALNG
jgi:hypothetical protein